MKKIILMVGIVCLALQAVAADLPSQFRGIWASDDAVFDGEWLLGGTAMYLDAQGNGIVMQGPVVASCKNVACARPAGMLFHATMNTDRAELIVTTEDMAGNVISAPGWRYDPGTDTLRAKTIMFEGTVLIHRSRTFSRSVMRLYSSQTSTAKKAFPPGFNAYIVPSAPMEPTLMTGTLVIVDLRAYKSRMPERGDIVAYEAVKDERNVYFHRIVGLPGDTVEIKEWTLFVNDKAVDVPYASLPKGREAFSRKMDEMTVPAGTVFVLGDNWDNSRDSRFQGVIALKDVLGKIFMRKPSKSEDEFTLVR